MPAAVCGPFSWGVIQRRGGGEWSSWTWQGVCGMYLLSWNYPAQILKRMFDVFLVVVFSQFEIYNLGLCRMLKH
jgi:hypothetical protein